MLLIGLGLLDINRVIDYREPPLRSFVGKVQGNKFVPAPPAISVDHT